MAANRATNHGRFTRFTTTDHLGAGVEYQNGKTFRVSMEVYSKRYRNAPFLVNDQIAYANAIGAYVAVGDQPSIPNAIGRARFELFLQQKSKATLVDGFLQLRHQRIPNRIRRLGHLRCG